MVSLSLMARLVEAVRPDARLMLVGDPGQLASIEAGVVLGGHRRPGRPTVGRVVVLERVHRYGGGSPSSRRRSVAATATRRWRRSGGARRDHVAGERRARGRGRPGAGPRPGGRGRRSRWQRRHARERQSTRSPRSARFRLLCAHRRGPYGVSDWTSRVVSWLAARVPELDVEQRDYVGRPLLVTENDYELGLYNGDTGVIVHGRRGTARARRSSAAARCSGSARCGSARSRPCTR